MAYLPFGSYAHCQTSSPPLSPRDGIPRADDECWATPLDWCLLIFSFLLLSITWWLLEIPTIWSHGFVAFMKRIAVHSLRLHVPTAQGILALARGRNPALWPKLYYYGGSEDDAEEVPGLLTIWQWVSMLVPDTLVVIGTCLGAYRFCAMGFVSYFPAMNFHLWLLPQLPAALVGYCILAASFLRVRNRFYVILLIYSVLVLVGFAFALAIYLPLRRHGDEAAELMEMQMVLIGALYCVMILPWTLLSCCCPVLLFFFFVCICMLARILIVSMDMLSDTYDTMDVFPFCQVSGESFAYAFITFGVLAWFLGSFGAGILYGYKQTLGDLKGDWRREKEHTEERTFVSLEEDVHSSGYSYTTTVCALGITFTYSLKAETNMQSNDIG